MRRGRSESETTHSGRNHPRKTASIFGSLKDDPFFGPDPLEKGCFCLRSHCVNTEQAAGAEGTRPGSAALLGKREAGGQKIPSFHIDEPNTIGKTQ